MKQSTYSNQEWITIIISIVSIVISLLTMLAFGGVTEPAFQTAPPEPPHALLIENVGGAHAMLPPARRDIPPVGEWFVQPETGIPIQRLTDVSLTTNPQSANPRAMNGIPTAGLTNGYSSWFNVNLTGEYMLAACTSPMNAYYDIEPSRFMGLVLAKIASNGGKAVYEPRWDMSGAPGTDTDIHYYTGNRYLKLNLWTSVSQVLWTFPVRVGNIESALMDDGGPDDANRYRPFKLINGEIHVYDHLSKTVLPGHPLISDGSSHRIYMSGDGEWLARSTTATSNDYRRALFRTSDLAAGNVLPVYMPGRGGHGAWCYKDGRSVFVWIEASTDWLTMLDPETSTVTRLMPMAEMGWAVNLHVARTPRAWDGWALISTYAWGDQALDDGWAYNQMWMQELKPNGRVVRLAHTMTYGWDSQGQVVGGGSNNYFTQAFASMSPDGRYVYWGANMLGLDNLEIYRMALPSPDSLAEPEPEPTPAEMNLTVPANIERLNITIER